MTRRELVKLRWQRKYYAKKERQWRNAGIWWETNVLPYVFLISFSGSIILGTIFFYFSR